MEMLARAAQAVLLGIALVHAGAASAIETVVAGGVGSASANLWPIYIGINKGLFAAEDIKIDLVPANFAAERLFLPDITQVSD